MKDSTNPIPILSVPDSVFLADTTVLSGRISALCGAVTLDVWYVIAPGQHIDFLIHLLARIAGATIVSGIPDQLG